MTLRWSFLSLFVLLMGCSGNSGSSVPAPSMDGYSIADLGSGLQHAVKKGANGETVEEGYLLNGAKTGTWIIYYAENALPQTITNYVNGVVSGLYLELNDRGQVELRASYKNNKLDGPWGKFRFGRPTHLAHYKEGNLDGLYQEFNLKDGKIMKEINYKSGKENGTTKFFNDKGEVTVQYEYKDGEKISGGILNADGSITQEK